MNESFDCLERPCLSNSTSLSRHPFFGIKTWAVWCFHWVLVVLSCVQ
jgi:hypothetical protein